MRLVSIDPGISGGLALLDHNPGSLPKVLEITDMPTRTRKKDGTGTAVSEAELSRLLEKLQPELVVIEHVTGMRGRRDLKVCRACKRPLGGPGESGLVNFGIGYGTVIGVCARYPKIYVSPSTWKKRLGIPSSAKDKDYARTAALDRFPYLADQLKRKKDVGRAEAVLIGLDYCSHDGGTKLVQAQHLGPVVAVKVPSGYSLELFA